MLGLVWLGEEFCEVDGVEGVGFACFVGGEELFGVFVDAEFREPSLDCGVVWAGVLGVVCWGLNGVEGVGVFLEFVNGVAGVEVIGEV